MSLLAVLSLPSIAMACLTSVLMILSVLAAPASEDRHVDAVEIFSYDFGSQWDRNHDLWPDKWRRVITPENPHYVQVQLADDAQAVAGRCLRVHVNGGGALVISPAVSVTNKFSYVVDARLKAEKLKGTRTKLRLDFCDEQRNVLESYESDLFGNTNDWVNLRIGPVSIRESDVRLAQVTLVVEKREEVDLTGVVSLDDIWLARLPRMTVTTNSPFNVYTDPRDVVVTCNLSGILEQDPDIRFELLDASSERLNDDTVQLDGRLITERLSKASDIINESVDRPKGYAGSTKWIPPIGEYGFYRVRVSMQTKRGTLKAHVISIAVVPPLAHKTAGEFGWSLAGDEIPLSFEDIEKLLPRAAVNWVKLPVWYGESEAEKGEQLVEFTERLAAKDIEVVGVIDSPPEDIDFGRTLPDDISIADLLTGEDPSSWLPSLDAVMTRLSLRVRWWQLGIDYDTSFSDFHGLEQEIELKRSQMFRFGQDVKVGIGWPWTKFTSSKERATWDFQQLSATPSFTGPEIETYMKLPRRDGVARWILVDPLGREHYSLEARTRDLVEQMIAAKIHGAAGIFVSQPFDDRRGIMTNQGTPGELLLPWRTTSALLSGARYLGQIRMPEGSENRIFETSNGEVLMVLWNRAATTEKLYLGEDVKIVDVWGRAKSPSQEEHRQVIEVANLPQFILGLEPNVARWRMNAHITEPNIPSVFGSSHANGITITNSYGQGAGGVVQLNAPEGWVVLPDKVDFKLSAGETADRPFRITLPFNAVSGRAPIRADFQMTTDRLYKFSVYREVTVGDEDIELELHTRLEDDGSLIVEQRMINHGSELVDFKCLLYAYGRRRQRMQVYRLSSSADVKTYHYQDGQDLIGREIWLRVEEQDGNRVFNFRTIAEE